ncbi:hypothetical protein GYMLUDRAFT_893183 [Collybiopsis luxurians FD-317 M1]|uniref:F-box domain-containing protein n=1 Tax=Collybiopsis luxurians FD-317 M1 TaxID=944289 RepID=A0A0D0AVX2_9AGAR|nr:hypothetical protein GYMLUDRAFT_893183 [Collybiopsis luxurians FD-317 M1]
MLTTDKCFSSKIPYERLNSLSFTISSQADIEQALRSCPSLTSLSIHSMLDFEEVAPTAPTTGRNVTSLRLNLEGSAFSQTILSSFNFPSLESLQFHGSESDPNPHWPRHAIGSFITRSSCSITTFAIHCIPISDVDLIAALRLMPSLRELKIADDKTQNDVGIITSHLISSMHFGRENYHTRSVIPLIPRLRCFHLDVNGFAFNHHAFVSMIVSRWLPDPDLASGVGIECLREVFLECSEIDIDVDTYEPLRDLDEMGLRVVVKDRNGIQV